MELNPDKYIRKTFFDKLNGINVNGKTIPVFDVIATESVPNLIILSTQSGSDDQRTKCKIDKNRRINIDVMTRFKGTTGSRALLDDITNKILETMQNITIENFTVNSQSVSFPNDMTMTAGTETIHRKIIIYNLNIT